MVEPATDNLRALLGRIREGLPARAAAHRADIDQAARNLDVLVRIIVDTLEVESGRKRRARAALLKKAPPSKRLAVVIDELELAPPKHNPRPEAVRYAELLEAGKLSHKQIAERIATEFGLKNANVVRTTLLRERKLLAESRKWVFDATTRSAKRDLRLLQALRKLPSGR